MKTDMTENMVALQHEQRDKSCDCHKNAQAESRRSDTVQLQDRLTGALIGLARAMDGNTTPTADTYSILIEGLVSSITEDAFDDDALKNLIGRVHDEKTRLVPQCGRCDAPCGRNNDYDMSALWHDNEEIRSLKTLILFGLRGMASYAHHGAPQGYTDDEVNRLLAYGLFRIGENLTVEQLLETVGKLGGISLKCRDLPGRAGGK